MQVLYVQQRVGRISEAWSATSAYEQSENHGTCWEHRPERKLPR
jgi:hypothetical protein